MIDIGERWAMWSVVVRCQLWGVIIWVNIVCILKACVSDKSVTIDDGKALRFWLCGFVWVVVGPKFGFPYLV